MNKTLHIIALLSLLTLVIAGCAKTAQEQTIGKNPTTAPAASPAASNNANTQQVAATNDSISGELTSVDKLNSDLDNNDLQNTDAQLSELSW
jgi:hypothetical protein